MTEALRYAIRPADPAAHLFAVELTVARPDSAGQLFSLPAWIPGSYMIREFARNIVAIHAESGGRAVALEKLDKHTWRAARVPAGQALVLRYEVYAWDLSVRGAHLDQTHGFFNGTSVFLRVHGQDGASCVVDLQAPADPALRSWKVATSLPCASGKGAAKAHGFGLYRAADYDELIDHPVEMGCFTLATFEAGGVPHEMAITGRHDCDTARLAADLARVCAWQIDLFGAPAPMARYVFLTTVVGDGYGGLEHRASTALLASRADLPYPGMQGQSDGYRQFLGLCSHEYFHTWNVKRIKPAAFVPYDLAVENHTRLLWAFEGFTSYYDDLALVRSGVIGNDDYLTLLGKTVSNVLRGAGRLRQSVAESSFDAWTKYYRQDENAPNAIVSYYAKGALIALALDLRLRAESAGGRSLDDVMRLLWRRHGQTGVGVAEDGVFAAVGEIGGEALARWLRRVVEGTQDLPLARLLKPFGIEWTAAPAAAGPWLGVKLGNGKDEARLASVYDGGPARRAGLSAGDVLVAFDGLKVNAGGLDAQLARRRPGERVRVHAFRRDELMEFEVELSAAPADRITLKAAVRPPAAAARLRRGWLGR
ncbi:M61 family metallopeptidase [Pseudothauera nasutitermitis]|uniref:M61 family metallopeptidase n=1 Tax=Pseudothauera nasutitermitis TaxID=2565930 RepID=A0A4S4B6K5_9RHOO|nr:PDZ domain-containing protein [Pseudothauera nasutitermitis]THF67466.1 M61 family metallopeptidase [Pseudothauera nasutitermitis]